MAAEQVGQTTRLRVWLADISMLRPTHLLLLNSIEKARQSAYQRAEDSARFTVAAALLRLATAAEVGATPTAIIIDRACEDCGAPHGKPRITGTDLHVSVSHSGRKVAVALTRAAPIGVDVEAISHVDVDELQRLCLTTNEPLNRPDEFYCYWCRKESVVKATGDGLRVPLTEVLVSPAGEPARLVSYRGRPMAATMVDLPISPYYAGAATVLDSGDMELEMIDAWALLG
jgi:4'-phosphopantetheinyl transferase